MIKEDYDIEVAKEYTTLQERIATLEKENKVLAQNLEDTEILNKTYEKRFSDLEKENAELKKLFADCDTCKRTCDIGNCCKFGSDYLPDVEKVLNEQKQLTKAKEIIEKVAKMYRYSPRVDEIIEQAEQFLSEVEK